MDVAEILGLNHTDEVEISLRVSEQELNCCIPELLHLRRVFLRVREMQLVHCFNQIFHHSRVLNHEWHQIRLSDILQVKSEISHCEVDLAILPLGVDEIFDHGGEGLREELAQLRVLENARSYAIHCQDLYAELGDAPRISAVLQKTLHVCNVSEAKMLLEVVRLEELDALLGHALA